MTDFSVYQPPGVYVEEVNQPLVGQVSASTTVVAIVGPSVGYRTSTEVVTLSDTTAVELAQQGIDLTTVIVTTLGGVVLELDEDYALDTDDADDERETVTSISREVGGDISSGQTVRVAYRYVDTNFHEPLIVRSYDEAESAFGTAFDSTGAIQSPLTLASKLAMDNGSGPLMLVSTVGAASQTTLSNAMEKLEAYLDVAIVVPLPAGMAGTEASPASIITTAQSLQSHVESMSSQGHYRVGIYGTDAGVTVDPATIAANTRSSRMMVAHPNRLLYQNPVANQTITIGGCYLAAAYAGRFTAQAVELPLTRRVIAGFSGISADAVSRVEDRNNLSAAGVSVAEVNRQRQLVCRHGVSTETFSFAQREISVVRARDTMMRIIEDTLEASAVIGQVVTAETPGRIRNIVESALESLLARGVFAAYQELAARQSQTNPTVIEVKFQYRPAYPINYVVVAFSIDADTGQTTLTAA
jgi:hypothetical protein